MSDPTPTMQLDGGPPVPVEAVIALLDGSNPDVLRASYWRAAYLVQQREAAEASEHNGSRGGPHASPDDDRSASVPTVS